MLAADWLIDIGPGAGEHGGEIVASDTPEKVMDLVTDGSEEKLVENKFELVANYEPKGDQPHAIREIVERIKAGQRHQTLLGATGTGKTFTMSNVIKEINRPTLVIAHNKTLAGQLYSDRSSIKSARCAPRFAS